MQRLRLTSAALVACTASSRATSAASQPRAVLTVVAQRRGSATVLPPPHAPSPVPSRFSRTRANTEADSTTSPAGSLRGTPAALASVSFTSAQTLTQGLHDVLRECSRGLSDSRREVYLCQLSRGSLRQVAGLEAKVVLLCLEVIRALTVDDCSLPTLSSDISHSLHGFLLPCAGTEATFCAVSCAHLVEEATQWMLSQGGRLQPAMGLRLVCAVSVLGYPTRVSLLAGYVQHLLRTAGFAHVSDNLRLLLLQSLADALRDDPHDATLQSGVATLASGETLGRCQFGSVVLTFSDVVGLLAALQPLVALPAQASLESHKALWLSLSSQLWTALVQTHVRDPSLQAVSLENAVLLWRLLARVALGSEAGDLLALREAVARRLLDELTARAQRGTCPGVVVAQLIQLARWWSHGAREGATTSPVLRELTDRVLSEASRVYEDMLHSGAATALSAAPLRLVMQDADHTQRSGPRVSFWESALVPYGLQRQHVDEAVPSTESPPSTLEEALAEAGLSAWGQARLDAPALWGTQTDPFTLATVVEAMRVSQALAARRALVDSYAAYLQAHIHLSSSVHGDSGSSGTSGIQSDLTVTPALLFPLLLASTDLSPSHRTFLTSLVPHCLTRWSAQQVVAFLQLATQQDDVLISHLLRDGAAVLLTHVPHASAAQLGALMLCYGEAGVRQEAFCQATTARVHALLNPTADGSAATTAQQSPGTASVSAATPVVVVPATPPPRVMVQDLAAVLAGLAAVETPTTSAFVDASPRIVECLPTVTDPFLVAQLMAAYARMLIWDFPLFWALAERLTELAADPNAATPVSFSTLVTGMLALIRMDVPHTALVKTFVARVAALEGQVADALARDQTVLLLSVLSRVDWAMLRTEATTDVAEATGDLGADRDAHPSAVVSARTLTAVHAVQEEIKAVVVTTLDQFSDVAFAEVVLCLARLDLLREPDATTLSPFVLRALALAPTASPLALSHLATAFSMTSTPNTELFAVLADRTVAIKNDISAATLGTILVAFADAKMENDRLFVEALPRVRYVADYGTPTDLANVVHAYASVHIWHYKLFSRIAERAVQVRHEFTGPTLVRFVGAYARVGMRQDKLLVEMASRVELIAGLLTAAELATIATSYAKLDGSAQTVFEACAREAVARPQAFAADEAEMLLRAFGTAAFSSVDATSALVTRFPNLVNVASEADGQQNEVCA